MGSCWSAKVKHNESRLHTSSSCSASVPSTRIPLSLRSEDEILQSSNLKSFAYVDLKIATRNFRPDSFIGEGGFGCVYKGWVNEQTMAPAGPGTGIIIAVKRLKQESFQGHQEWLAEINYLGQLEHPNLVKLIGYCLEEDHRLLVYEFMNCGSLERHLYTRSSDFQPLSWNLRMKVALGAAKGLKFLHSQEVEVIYRDFKPANILLDSEFNAKLSDFGLAKDGPTGEKSYVSTRVMGTQGYAAPEYMSTGHLTKRSDVYSFGVVLLEILSGRRVLEMKRSRKEQNLVQWATPYLQCKRKVFEIMDTRIEGQYSSSAVQKIARLALECLCVDPRFRPNMTRVVAELEQLQDPALGSSRSGSGSSKISEPPQISGSGKISEPPQISGSGAATGGGIGAACD
ncbi:hypothetical protein Nepgr_022538 [Nepenthes gracilis]|uniref:non-specific serine/threonine protein kinase n=1 Tax=Nepenthes gracilis TaxID=150966 RepID=A0AAD3XWX0_NEPGR|nr:hypothetical protein Nepgr_022538 [Nepenthes gracilis]